MIRPLQEWAAQRGFRVACGGPGVLHEVKAELGRRLGSGELDREFHSNNLTFFRYEKSSPDVPDIKAVILVAMPRPAHRVTFNLDSGPLDVILPPTYLRYSPLFREIRDDITSSVPELRGHLEILAAPLKAISSRLGLSTYGRNNVTYIPGWGSYFQLFGYISDLDFGLPADWTPTAVRLLPECEDCGICSNFCSTGAIAEGRILLHAENCTTLFSETPGELTHELSGDCLFGCLECQEMCPLNAGLLRIQPSGVTFTPSESDAILAGEVGQKARESIRQKLDVLGLTEESMIPRNLAHIIRVRSRAHGI